MYTENEINTITSEKITGLKSSISNLRDKLFVSDLKEDLKEFVTTNIQLDEANSYPKTEIITGAPSWFPKAHLSRTQTDLISTSADGEELIFHDYFTNHEPPSIQTENGLMFNGSLINIMAGQIAPGQYVQAAGQQNLSIGEVSSVSGSAQATRIDGTTFSLSNGDPVFQGDQIEVSSSGAVGLVFLDKTTLSLSEGGKMVLDELIYDPSSGTGSLAVDMVEGAFSFISGEIAKTGPDAMTIKTPVATVGIRGTTVAGKAAVEGNENSFTLLQDADGGVGQISVSNAAGTQVLEQIGATTSIASFNVPPPAPIILSAAQIQANYGTALNVLPPTPVIAPTPQPPPPPQEQTQDSVQEDEESSEEEGVDEEEGLSDDVISEDEVQEENEELPEGGIALEEELLDEEGPIDVDEEQPVVLDDEPLTESDETQLEIEDIMNSEDEAAREAFDTALASGATPEEAMAEAAAVAGFDGSPPAGATNSNLEPIVGESEDLIDSFGEDNSPSVSEFSDLLGNFSPSTSDFFNTQIVSNIAGPINSDGSTLIVPAFVMGPIMETKFGSGVQDPTGLGLFGQEDSMFSNATGFNDPLGGFINLDSYGSPESISSDSYYFEDASLYDDYSENETTETETDDSSGNESSSEITTDFIEYGSENNDTLDKTSSTNSWTLIGKGGQDTLIGGNDDDVIVGGSGSDIMTGGDGDDKFYYKNNTLNASDFDIISDFTRASGNKDKIVAESSPTSTYDRKNIHVDSSQYGISYNLADNADELPSLFNFTYDHNVANISSASAVANQLITFGIIPNSSELGLPAVETSVLALGDGFNTYLWLWEDDNKSGYIAESELYPITQLTGFDNFFLDGNELDYQSISGV